jgi:hypothetical protein
MIRAACSWVLIVLAASPFTAPFAACNINALLGHHAAMAIALSVSSSADIAPCSEIPDVESLSPLVGRIVLSRDSALVIAGRPVQPTPDTPMVAQFAPAQYARALEDCPLQLPVLRL